MEKLRELYRQWCGEDAAAVEKLPGAGSARVYYRMFAADGRTVVGCVGTSRDENHAFVYLARHFGERHLPVPRVLAVADDEMRYLQTDLGGTSLFEAVRGGREAGGRYTVEEQELLRRTVRALPALQIEGARGLDFAHCYPQPAFDVDGVLFDLNYFKYCFLKATGVDFHELKLEADFRLMAKDLTQERQEAFLYRDFQARNVMMVDGSPHFIDFQGGRRGPVYYDLASFLWQASALYPDGLRRRLVAEYYDALSQYTEVPDTHHFAARLSLFVLFRLLQVLGAYGFRGYFERKRHFIDSIPPAVDNLRRLLDEGPAGGQHLGYPHLADVLRRLCALPQFQTAGRAAQDGPATRSPHDGQGPLVVRVYSFSYRKGIPADESGNGGGYVFDCRATHNPGRYEPYKRLTGLDEPVIRFLEDDGEILRFMESVYQLADAHVGRYIDRGFTSLMFALGCTGGQHRSVYAAQHLAEHVSRRFGVEVRLTHREQGISSTFPAR